jgi:hypothetical protein
MSITDNMDQDVIQAQEIAFTMVEAIEGKIAHDVMIGAALKIVVMTVRNILPEDQQIETFEQIIRALQGARDQTRIILQGSER